MVRAMGALVVMFFNLESHAVPIPKKTYKENGGTL